MPSQKGRASVILGQALEFSFEKLMGAPDFYSDEQLNL